MMTGMTDFIMSSGRMTPMEQIPTADFAVPYAAPNTVSAWADMHPRNLNQMTCSAAFVMTIPEERSVWRLLGGGKVVGHGLGLVNLKGPTQCLDLV